VLVTGPSASGKSSLLDAIAAVKESAGPYGTPPDAAALGRSSGSSGRIEATWLLSADEVRRAQLGGATWVTTLPIGPKAPAPNRDPKLASVLGQYFHEPSHGKFELFPANRRLIVDGPPRGVVPPLSERAEARLRLGRAPDKYACVRSWLVDLGVADGMRIAGRVAGRGVLLKRDVPDSLASVKRGIAELAPHLRMIGVEERGGRHAVLFQRADGAEVELEALSDSEQQAVLFAAVFRRIALSRSIVLIDQPELFFHPDDHTRVLHALGGLGEDNQIFAATTSEGILREAAPHQIIRLVSRRAGR
jgi:energy-coupling factor transporter ATP-binding protein EcfA2